MCELWTLSVLYKVVGTRSPARRGGGGFARGVGIVGEIVLTLGLVVVLFAVYQLWWTNVTAQRETAAARAQALSLISINPGAQPTGGTAFALMYIPRLRDRVWQTPVIQGVQPAELARGIGHYPQTAMPGAVGNFAVAGHRATNGEPFADFDRLQRGDVVIVQTAQAWFTYRLEKDQIVSPAAVWTIEPQPLPTGTLANDKVVTLTTCHPRWASTSRWIYWGSLVSQSLPDDPPTEVR